MHRFLLPSSRSLLLSPTSRLIGSVFAGNLKTRLLPFPKFAISNAFMSSSSAPDSGSSGFKEGSSDSKISAAVPEVSLEVFKESGLSTTGTTVSAQQDEAAWSYKGMPREEVTNQIVFLNKMLRKTAELESEKMALLKKTDKSANDILVLGEVKEQLDKMNRNEADYKAELRELQEAIGNSTTATSLKESTERLTTFNLFVSTIRTFFATIFKERGLFD